MDLKSQLTEALKHAMRTGDETRKRTIRLALTEVKVAEKASGNPLEDPDVLAILQKELKSRRESIADAKKAGRSDLVEAAKSEMIILEEYLPQPLSVEEITHLAQEVITEVNATSPKEMGMVMKTIMPQVRGRAEGGEVSRIVRQLLIGE